MRRIVVLVLMAVLLLTCSGFSGCFLWLEEDEEEEHEHEHHEHGWGEHEEGGKGGTNNINMFYEAAFGIK